MLNITMLKTHFPAFLYGVHVHDFNMNFNTDI